MGEVPMLLLALLVLHLSEFVVWVRPDVGLFRRRGRGWELASRGALISTVRGSLHWVYPLPGWARAYAVPWTTGNLPAAHPEGGAGLESVFSRSEVERRRNSVEMAFRELRWLSWSLMGLVWVVAPVTLQWIGLRSMLWIVLPPLLVLMAVNAVRVFQTHRRQYPESGDERLRLVLSASLSPLAAIRSADLVHKGGSGGLPPAGGGGGFARIPRLGEGGCRLLATPEPRRVRKERSRPGGFLRISIGEAPSLDGPDRTAGAGAGVEPGRMGSAPVGHRSVPYPVLPAMSQPIHPGGGRLSRLPVAPVAADPELNRA